MTTFALAVPHLPHIQGRADNMDVMRRMLGVESREEKSAYAAGVPCGEANVFREFTEKAPWPERMLARWKWALETKKDWFLALEDDVIVAPDFWKILEAMTIAWPGPEFLGLSATHSLGPAVALQGRRSYNTPKLLGWAWACPMYVLELLYNQAVSGALEKYHRENPLECEDTAHATIPGANHRRPLVHVRRRHHQSSHEEQ
jgi:hypothetical protein